MLMMMVMSRRRRTERGLLMMFAIMRKWTVIFHGLQNQSHGLSTAYNSLPTNTYVRKKQANKSSCLDVVCADKLRRGWGDDVIV